MQETLISLQKAAADLSIRQEQKSDSGSIRQQRMQEQKSLYQTTDAGDILSDSGFRSAGDTLSATQRMQKTLYQTADAEVSLSHSGCRSL